MCGRYYIDDETAHEIEKIVREVNDKLLKEQKPRDVYPSGVAPIITGQGEKLVAEEFIWGFPHFADKNKVIFNARAESVYEKPMFRDSIANRRCIIPATGFYEWNKNKDKYYFDSKRHTILLLAGVYKPYEKDRFVILTTSANESMREIHDRMPVIIEPGEVKEWMFSEDRAKEILKKKPEQLKREIRGQMTLLDI